MRTLCHPQPCVRPVLAERLLHGRFALAAVLAAALWLGGCASPLRTDPSVPDVGPITPEVEAGMASWYGERFQGRRTASGEAFNMNDLTAAHPSLPFGTRVRVRNLDNGREVVVRINDRGPFARGRIIDLSRAAALTLGFLQAGTARVSVQRD